MSVTLRWDAKFYADEIPALLVDLATNPTLQHRIAYPGVSGLVDASTAIAVDDAYSDRRALTAGAYTLDLTALTSTLGASKDFTGKKVKAIVVVPSPSNTAGIMFRYGATNGYLIFGTETGEVTAYPGLPVMQIYGNNLLAVDATRKNIAFTSSDTDAEFEIVIVVGT